MTELILEAEKEGIRIIENGQIGRLKGLYVDSFIILNAETEKEKRCILCEELGHHYTSYGNILDQTKIENIKQEKKARAWAYEKLINTDKLINALKHGVKNCFELAEFLNVTEEFVDDAFKYFKGKYGLYYKTNDIYITFEPLKIERRFE
jgi:Zn-dependent peptidase ImmA (M78 family)